MKFKKIIYLNMSEENDQNEEKEQNDQNEQNEEKEHNEQKEQNEENFTTYEDDIIILLNKLSDTIETFNTLSRDQAENAILETNIKISSCKEILDKMEQYIKNLDDEDESEKVELNKKLLNYKTEYHEILNKYNEIQENYINKKTENALMEDKNESYLVDEDKNRSTLKSATGGAGDPYMIDGELSDENKKKNKKENKKENKKDNKKENENDITNNTNNINSNKIEKNSQAKNEISLISVSNNDHSILGNNNIGYSLNPNKEKEETFHEINQDYNKKRRQQF